MAVTINASTSAGLVQTADTSGVLALQTAGTTAVTVNASQVVSIGTTNVGGTLNTTTTSGNWGEIIYDLANNASMLQFRNNAGSAAGNISLSSAGATSLLISSVAGVNFPATQVASANANTLDDYEEGSWTPAWAFSTSGSATVVVQGSWYIKIGRLVTVQARFYTDTMTGVGTATVTGLPFTGSGTNPGSGSAGEFFRTATDFQAKGLIAVVSGTSITFKYGSTLSNLTDLQASDLNTSATQNIVGITITYQTS